MAICETARGAGADLPWRHDEGAVVERNWDRLNLLSGCPIRLASGDVSVVAAYRAAVLLEAMWRSTCVALCDRRRRGGARRERWADMPLWQEVTESLRKAGVLVANGPLHPAASATTVRVRGDETELTDGPFAVTKEVLAGYYVLDCADLDEAVQPCVAGCRRRAYGSVEVRPMMADDEIPRPRSATGLGA